ncbi:MAG: CRTAC1 family protein [Planctomycetia bacterium]|nr:CRTAC1 family protein [Planctomycetia bacterium]
MTAPRNRMLILAGVTAAVVVIAAGYWKSAASSARARRSAALASRQIAFEPRRPLDTSGLKDIVQSLEPWPPNPSLEEIAAAWNRIGYRNVEAIDRRLAEGTGDIRALLPALFRKATFLNYEGAPAQAYDVLAELRSKIESHEDMSRDWLYTVVFMQGVTALRRGENENCIHCRGESSCILPIAPAAVHINPAGSRLAIRHFTEYLEQFPDDLEVRWLLNLAYMTLGEHPDQVDPRFVLTLDHFRKSEFDIGRFRDVGHLVGVNRLNLSGGAIMDDFDNDGLLDIVITSIDPNMSMAVYRNSGDGRFDDATQAAGVAGQLGGLYCVQADYNNDGFLDVYIPRGAWLDLPMRPSLLENNGDGTFSDVTHRAKLLVPVNSNSAAWADYDNDGQLDLFVCCEAQRSRLFHNRGDGAFDEVAVAAGLGQGDHPMCKGATWVDIDNDGDPDLFVDFLTGKSRLFRNDGKGRFRDATEEFGVDGPMMGFACWAWDYDNDGWLDIFATCYERTLADIVKGLLGRPHERNSNRLYRNVEGQRFEDVTQAAGLDLVFATMGCNFGDFDNDGWLDMFLGTGDPFIETLVPDRMFKNVAGRRFSEVTAGAGTGHLQKGHAVACGDWDRDGNVDIFMEIGGIALGDKYHNVLFQNPGHDNQWITLKLVGRQTNRAAIGARIKVVTAGSEPQKIHRHISSGSSFGANPLEQTIGLGKAERVALIEIHWPASGTTQVVRDVPVGESLRICEFSDVYEVLRHDQIPLPAAP